MTTNEIFIKKCITTVRVFKDYDFINNPNNNIDSSILCSIPMIPVLNTVDKFHSILLKTKGYYKSYYKNTNCYTNIEVNQNVLHNNFLELSTTYNPIEEGKEIFTELIKINDIPSLKKFIKIYGLPESESNKINPSEKIFNLSSLEVHAYELCFISSNLVLIFQKLEYYQTIFSLWVAIKNKDRETLRRIYDYFKMLATKNHQFKKRAFTVDYTNFLITQLKLKEVENYTDAINNKSLDLQKLFNSVSSDLSELWNLVKNETNEKIALAYFSYLLNQMPSGEIYTTYINGHIIPALKFIDLFEVAYYQLKQAVYADDKLGVCQNCNNFFIISHGNQKFCSPNRNLKESTCRNTYKKRIQRAKNK